MRVYLDNAATTKVDSNVAQIIAHNLTDNYANPSSLHLFAQDAQRELEFAREVCADSINAKASEIYFTASATISDNIAIIGVARANKDKGKHIITTSIEHHAVLNSCIALENEGFEVTYLPVDSEGLISIRELKDAIRKDTILISIMYVNNEIGTVQPIKEIGEIARKKGIIFHSDAVQAYLKIPIDVVEMNIDLLSVSAHKVHGPKGCGFLYKSSKVKAKPVIHGGEQERGLSSGTINSPLIAGFRVAVENGLCGMLEREDEIKKLRDYLIDRVVGEIDGVSVNGSLRYRVSSNANFMFDGVKTDALLYAMDLKNIAISAGSACTVGTVEVSHVIKALGKNEAFASARFTLSKFTTKEEIDYTVDTLKEVVKRLRQV